MVFNEYSERFQARPGGYTRLYKLGFRTGDNAPMNLVQLIPAGEELVLKAKKTAPKKAAAKETAPVVDAAPSEEVAEDAAVEATDES
jgi:large subunit ribosomal protein L17